MHAPDDPPEPYTDQQLAGIERIAALADPTTTIPRLLANLAQLRRERDEARAARDELRALDTIPTREAIERVATAQRLAQRMQEACQEELDRTRDDRDRWKIACSEARETAAELRRELDRFPLATTHLEQGISRLATAKAYASKAAETLQESIEGLRRELEETRALCERK